MAEDRTRDARIDQLEAQLAAQRAEFAAFRAQMERPRRRLPRRHLRGRFLPLALVALLVVLTPLALLAASPFNDLTGGVHDANIGLIYDAGITKGCVPNVSYCPTANVTREEMASFLARTAGLGTNPPVVNAKTAQTATNATNATHAASADTATNAQNAQNAVAAGHAASADTATTATNAASAGDAATLGGYAPGALNRVAFSATPLVNTLPVSITTDIVRITLTIPGPAPQAVAVRGAFNAYNQLTGGFISTFLRQDGPANTVNNPTQLNFPYQTTGTFVAANPYAEWVFVAPPGTHTYTLVVQASGMAGDLTISNAHLIATTHPFGATGTAGTTEIDPGPPPVQKP